MGAVGQARAALTSLSDTARRRLAICMACPTKRLRPDGVCDACGCYVPDKVKLNDQHCPDGHWSRTT